MVIRTLLIWLSFAIVVGANEPVFAQMTSDRGGMDETGPYHVVENWFKPGIDFWRRTVTCVAVDTPNRIFVATADGVNSPPGSLILDANGKPVAQTPDSERQSSEASQSHAHLLLVFSADGKVTEDWSQWNDLIVLPHNIAIDPYDRDRHVWVIDREGQQILKFTNDGKKLVLKLGEKGVPGTDHGHFNLPAGIAFLPDGSFYVADGYRNTRIVKFDRNGKFQLEWGTKGTGPGQFNLVHAVAIDKQNRVFVADRGNNRIQIFDASGKFLDQWPNVSHPTYLTISDDNRSVWVASGTEDRMVKYDMNGKLQTYWGVHGNFPGGLYNPHSFAVDAAGNLYIADSFNNRVQKFTPRPDADKARLVDQPFVFNATPH